MALTALDPVSALVVIDLQRGIVDLPTVHPAADIVQKAAQLAAAFRRRGLPVVLVTAAGFAPGRTETPRSAVAFAPGWDELVPELGAAPSDLRVVKRTWGAFRDTGLEAQLKDRGVTQIVLCGIATSLGVESTARQAHECGFNVTLAVDAMTDRDADVHLNSVTRIFPRLGETGTAADVLALLER